MSRASVTLQVRSSGSDAYGQLSDVWTDVKSLGATVSAVTLSEAVQLNREIHTSLLRFSINRSPTSVDIVPDNRLSYRGRFYYVVSNDTFSSSSEVLVIGEERR